MQLLISAVITFFAIAITLLFTLSLVFPFLQCSSQPSVQYGMILSCRTEKRQSSILEFLGPLQVFKVCRAGNTHTRTANLRFGKNTLVDRSKLSAV